MKGTMNIKVPYTHENFINFGKKIKKKKKKK